MLQAIERYMKQAIVDKVSSVSSSALVSSLVSEQVIVWFSCMMQFLVAKTKYHCDSITNETLKDNLHITVTLYKIAIRQRALSN